MKPVCTKCQRFYRPKRNGTYFTEMKSISGFYAPPGLTEPGAWEPYKLWCGDLWECRGCGHELIVGVGHQPVSQDYKPDFHDMLERSRGLEYPVNDC